MTLPVAVLDSCVLFPNLLRDTLLSTAEAGLYRAHWSREILDGLTRNLIARQILTREKALYLEEIMLSYFPEAIVDVPDGLSDAMTNHEGDRHVLAAAVKASARFIITFNLKHFSLESTLPWGIEALHPDRFLLDLLEENPSALLDVLEKQAARFRKPPLSLQELLDGLARQTPRFVSSLRDSLL